MVLSVGNTIEHFVQDLMMQKNITAGIMKAVNSKKVL